MEDTVEKSLLTWGQCQVGWIGGLSGLTLVLLGVPIAFHAATLHDPREVFPPGEKLVYQVRWNPPAWAFFLPPVNAGELTFQVHSPSIHEGRQIYRVTADAISSGLFLKVAGISVRDHFESLIDPQEFCSVKMTKLLREGKRQRDVFQTVDRKTGTGRYQAYDVSKDPRVVLKDQELQGLPYCVQDVISAIYLTRLHDLKVGGEFPLTISDNGVVKDVQLRITKREAIEAEAGKYTALRIETFSVFGGLFRQGGTLVVWVSDDAKKMPVRFEARVSFGKVEGSIKRQAE
ncbi:MAG TPA: DUF3108 domain-containing protein [Terriglobia bacterium]|nr:DUF3108 domain-containing protein [Terriglobia bacterium]